VSERRTAASITDIELTALYDKLAQAGRTVAGLQAANQRLRDRLAQSETEAATNQAGHLPTACEHPITEIVANLPRLDLVCRACGTILAEHTGDDHLPDHSWVFACPDPACLAERLTPCVRRNGTRAAISHGKRWVRYDEALRVALRSGVTGGSS
jgi:hypothetical protein